MVDIQDVNVATPVEGKEGGEQSSFPTELKNSGFTSYEDVNKMKAELEEAKSFKIHPMAEKLNDLFSRNVDQEQIRQYFDLQFMDLSKLSPEDSIRKMYSIQRPDLNDYDVSVLMEQKYGRKPSLDDFQGDEKSQEKYDEAIKRYSSSLKIGGGEAIDFLNSQKVKMDVNLGAEQSKTVERRATLVQASSLRTLELVKEIDKLPIEFTDEVGDYKFDFNLRLTEPEQVEMAKSLAMAAVDANIDLSTKEGQSKIKEFYQNHLIWGNSDRRIEALKAIIKHTHDSAVEGIKKEYAKK